MEDINRVRRACTMHSLDRQAAGREESSVFGSSLVLLEFSQADNSVMRRAAAGAFGEEFATTQLGRNTMISNFCRFRGLEPIINFFPNQTLENAFRLFLEKEPASRGLFSDLLNEMNRILTARQSDPDGLAGSRFQAVFATPQQAVWAAASLSVARVSPTFREILRDRLMNEWLDRIALNPEQYKSQDDIAKIFEEFRSEGRFD